MENVKPNGYTISADGTVAAFVDQEGVLYHTGHFGGTNDEIDRDVQHVLAAGSVGDGDSVFYIKENGKLYYSNGKDTIRLSKGTVNGTLSSTFYFNKDCSEILYMEDGEVYFYKKEMEEAEAVGRVTNFFSVAFAQMATFTSASPKEDDMGRMYARILGKETLEGLTLYDQEEFYWLDPESRELERLGTRPTNWLVARDYSSVLYLEDDELYRKELTGDEEKILLYEEVIQYAASADLSEVYVITTDGTLVYLDQKGKETELLEGETLEQIIYSDYLEKLICITEGQTNYYLVSPKEEIWLGTSEDFCLESVKYGIVTYEEISGEETDIYVLQPDGSGAYVTTYENALQETE